MLTKATRILYLHGFASSPQSRKAQFFAAKLEGLGWRVSIPDLAEGAFEKLTVSRQLALVGEELQGEPAVLIGSSLGGYVAALYAARHPEVERLVLLAPAFDFYRLWMGELGPKRVAEWRETGTIPVFHYGAGREMALGYEFLEDARRFEPFPDVRQPALICHGNADQVVPVEHSVTFAEEHASARLVRFESGHELTDVLTDIWDETEKFLAADVPG